MWRRNFFVACACGKRLCGGMYVSMFRVWFLVFGRTWIMELWVVGPIVFVFRFNSTTHNSFSQLTWLCVMVDDVSKLSRSSHPLNLRPFISVIAPPSSLNPLKHSHLPTSTRLVNSISSSVLDIDNNNSDNCDDCALGVHSKESNGG